MAGRNAVFEGLPSTPGFSRVIGATRRPKPLQRFADVTKPLQRLNAPAARTHPAKAGC